MFGFLSKLFGRKQSDRQEVQPRRKKQVLVQNDAKIEAVQSVGHLPDDDSAIVEFLKQTRFADARYAAALRLQSVEAMIEVRSFTQKTDRRVYRLMQTRLNGMRQSQEILAKAEAVLAEADSLVKKAGLAPNQVADLERHWHDLYQGNEAVIPAKKKERYEACLKQLGNRLQDQLSLQQEIRQASESLDTCVQQEGAPGETLQVLTDFEQRLAAWKQSFEVASLPKNTISEFEGRLKRFKAEAEKSVRESESVQARSLWLEKYEQEPVESLKRTVLEQEWGQLPQVKQVHYTPLLRRYSALRDKAIACENLRKQQQKAISKAKRQEERQQLLAETAEDREAFRSHLEALRQAIDTGAIQEAQRHGEALSQIHLDSRIVDKELLEECSQMQAELRQLNDWAKWSDRLSRENLVKAAEALCQKQLGIDDLADAVMQLRDQWKSLNTVSGMATREQWATFDAACNKAYEPVLVHARAQVDEKKKNIRYAEGIIADIKTYADRFQAEFEKAVETGRSIDWKPIINFYRQTLQSWRQLGIVGRNEKKRLDAEMAEALAPVRDRLYEQTRLEIQRRENLIAEVERIDANHPESGKKLRAIQLKWQAGAKNFPLDNRKDSKLWNRFKAVCESLHERRMEKGHQEDQERLDNLQQKEAICAELESLDIADGLEAFDERFLSLTKRWNATGGVPQESGEAVQKRFDAAVSRCMEKVKRLRKEGLASAVSSGLVEKLRLCSELENRILRFLSDNDQIAEEFSDEDFDRRWQALPQLSDSYLESLLSNRFYNGLKAAAARNVAYGRRLQNNIAVLKDSLLTFEAIYGLASPAGLEEERQQKQQEIQQHGSGNEGKTLPEDVAKTLLELPAPVDESDISRVVAVLAKQAGC
mgnify:CR=1 FL=1